MELLEQQVAALPQSPFRSVEVEVDERAARRSLREQIAKLERELGDVFASAFPRSGIEVSVPSWGGPRLLSLGELEQLRDDLAQRLRGARAALGERTAIEESNRQLIERMMLEPARYKFVRVAREDIGERGCGHWEVRPRLGLIGMLMGWWQVKLSSGCPLAGGRRGDPRGPGPAERRLSAWAGEAASARGGRLISAATRLATQPTRALRRRVPAMARRCRRRAAAVPPASRRRRRGEASRSSSCASSSAWSSPCWASSWELAAVT